jgi:hypothetical protein
MHHGSATLFCHLRSYDRWDPCLRHTSSTRLRPLLLALTTAPPGIMPLDTSPCTLPPGRCPRRRQPLRSPHHTRHTYCHPPLSWRTCRRPLRPTCFLSSPPPLCHLHQIWERGIVWKSSTGADSHALPPRPRQIGRH